MNRRLPRMVLPLFLVLGCAASGASFRPIESIPEGKAVVYIYRPNSLIGGGIRYHVAVGNQRIVYLIRGGYFPYLAEPGETEFWARTEAKETITSDFKAGEVYYLKGTVGIGLAVGRPRFEFVSQEIGAEEVAKCKLLPAAQGNASE